MWLVNREQAYGCTILEARNVRLYRPSEIPHLSVDDFCVETRSMYELCVVITMVIHVYPFGTSLL